MSNTTTQYNYFKGIARVTQSKRPNSYGAYTVCIEFDDSSELEKFKASGIQVDITDNKAWVRRPHQKLIKNELVTLGPPRVVDKDGNDLNVLVGDGSEVIVKVRTYPTSKGIGHTLDAIQVLNLVEVPRSDAYHNF